MISASGVGISYDARGNLSSDGAVTYGYNAKNLLTSTSSGATLAYDASDRLLSISKAGVTTKFLYDGTDMIAEFDGAGTVLRRYVHGAGVDEPLVWLEKNASNTFDKRYLYADNQGSIIGVTDASGNKIAINAYDEYGVPQGGNLGRFQYTGQAYMAEVGLYYYKARFYSPTLGRFMQPDPIGYSDGLNLYAYVGNDPVNMTDPSGLYGSPHMDGTPNTLPPITPGVIYTEHEDSITVTAYRIDDFTRELFRKAQNWAGALPRGNGEPEETVVTVTGKKKQKIISPSNVNIDDLICEARHLGENTSRSSYNSSPVNGYPYDDSGFQAANQWYNNVKGKGKWDFKRRGMQFEGYGNFAFGATGHAVGIPDEVLLRGAGWAQEQAGSQDKSGSWGHWYQNGSHGDDPLDQASIREGIEYAKAHPCTQ